MIRCNVAYHSYCLPEKLEEIPKNDWFCPFCVNKPENAQHFSEQTNSNVLPSEAATSNSSLLKNEMDNRLNMICYSNQSSKQDGLKTETTKCSSITESESSAIHGNVESESIESNYSDGNSESYSGSDTSADNYDDSESEDTDHRVSSEIIMDDSEAENTNGKLIMLNN